MNQDLLSITSLNQLYSTPSTQRYSDLIQAFSKTYNLQPTHFARAPGRVNVHQNYSRNVYSLQIIGEHIDYMGYGVLPFALEKDAVIAFAQSDSPKLVISHVNPNEYPQHVLELTGQPTIINNYVLYVWAGYQAALQAMNISNPTKGCMIMVTGNVPLSSGLSSSSALTVCMGITTVQLYDGKPNALELVNCLIHHERLAGTACGGMDQSISVLGKQGQALYIQFDPIRPEKVPLPEGYAFVIANSLTPSAKLTTLGTRYNKRVCECRMALAILSKKLGINERFKSFAELQSHLKLSLESMSLLVKENIENKDMSVCEVEKITERKIEEILDDIPQKEVVLQANQHFSPYLRALHICQESNRVLQFIEICNSNLPNDSKALMLGKLMNDSQTSCHQLYDCSSENLETLVKLCRSYGALGSRLTGAGWGGCTVSMVKESQVQEFLKNVKESFYKDVKEDLESIIFISKPSNGAVAFDQKLIAQ